MSDAEVPPAPNSGGRGDSLPFTKMQAVGNDFVVIEETVWGAGTDWPQAAIRLCNRYEGVGGDGLLVVSPSETADVRMRMFNPDGTEDMCGNGLRCVVRWAVDHGYFAEDSDPIFSHRGTVETLVGVRGISVEKGGIYPPSIWTNMGVPLFHPDQLPALVAGRDSLMNYPLDVEGYGTVAVSTVNTGSTHTILWVDELPEDELFFGLSPKIEHHPIYPERTSVLWAKVHRHDGHTNFAMRIWERGVGETLGCGTGACAVIVTAQRLKKDKNMEENEPFFLVNVHSAGGDLSVIYIPDLEAGKYYMAIEEDDDSLQLIGTAHTVYSGFIAR
ncbi:MAG: diaminopimelate epimerase [Akkermansiaceae bacterium]|nr:diaminopimelate epimerase [Armatimonadota bacterium]